MSSRTAEIVYLDYHATSPLDEQVLQAMLPFFRENFGNPSSAGHEFGWRAADAIDEARERVARFCGCAPREVIFTSGATEANNLAIKGLHRTSPQGSADRLSYVSVTTEHRAVIDPLKSLRRRGHSVEFLSVDESGRLDLDRFEESCRRSDIASVMWVNNEIGIVHPIQEISRICEQTQTVLHTDAVQAASFIPLHLNNRPISMLSLSAHKISGPKGIGALITRRTHWPPGLRLLPQIEGGGQQDRLRSGTLPVPLIVGMGKACELADQTRDAYIRKASTLRNHLWNQLAERIDGLTLNGPELSSHPADSLSKTRDSSSLDRHPGNLNVLIPRIRPDALLASLKRVAVSSGAACSSSDPDPSHVLRAIGRTARESLSSLRFGIGPSTTEREIEICITELVSTVEALRQQSGTS